MSTSHAGLILSRRVGEVTIIGGDATGHHRLFDANGDPVEIALTLLGVKGNQARIGVLAPKQIPVHRQEIEQRIRRETREEAAEAENAAVPA